jgi:hypothetical protein
MPTDLVTIVRVQQFDTRIPGLHRYTIDADEVGTGAIKQYGTINAWLASLCDRAREPVQVTWKDSRFGKDIVQVTTP